MSTIELESTLFGGWAKRRTPYQIDVGVSINSGSVFHWTSGVTWSVSPRLYTSDPNRFDIQVSLKQGLDGNLYRVMPPDLEADSRKLVLGRIADHFRYRAFVRFAEVWGHMGLRVSDFKRAVLGTDHAARSYAGMLGAQNNKSVRKTRNGTWQVINLAGMYPFQRIPLLSADTIRAIRDRAREKSKDKKTQ